jgi:hypothetical protein
MFVGWRPFVLYQSTPFRHRLTDKNVASQHRAYMLNLCTIPLQQFGMKPALSCYLPVPRLFIAACISAATGELIPTSPVTHGLT